MRLRGLTNETGIVVCIAPPLFAGHGYGGCQHSSLARSHRDLDAPALLAARGTPPIVVFARIEPCPEGANVGKKAGRKMTFRATERAGVNKTRGRLRSAVVAVGRQLAYLSPVFYWNYVFILPLVAVHFITRKNIGKWLTLTKLIFLRLQWRVHSTGEDRQRVVAERSELITKTGLFLGVFRLRCSIPLVHQPNCGFEMIWRSSVFL